MRKSDYSAVLLRGIAVILLLLFAAFIAPVAMVGASVPTTFDGDRCPGVFPENWTTDEWGAPDFVDGDEGHAGTAEILNVWAGLVDTDIYLAFNREKSGKSTFFWYFNTDCNTTNNDTAHGGAEWAAFFAISRGAVSSNTLWKWDSSTSEYVDSGTSFSALVGEYVCGDGTTEGEFFEMKINVSDIFEPCNESGSGCGDIDFVGGASAAGSPNSKKKDVAIGNITIDVNLPPTAEAGDNQTACRGSAVNLNGSGSTDPENNIVLYEWDVYYDGITFDINYTGVTASHAYAAQGTYTVGLRVTDLWGCNDTDTLNVTVLQAPTANISITHLDPCNLTITYDGTGSTDPNPPTNLAYSWIFGDGVGISSVASGTYTYALPGTYTISLTVTDPESDPPCNTGTATAPLTVKDCTDPVIVNVTQSSDEPCAGQPVLVTARVTDDVNVTSVNMTYDGTNVSMTMVSGTAKDGNWTETIPGQPACTTLNITINASDAEGNSDSYGPHAKHWIDCNYPVFVSVTQNLTQPCAGQPVLVTARVMDDVGVTSVNLTYDGTNVSMTMVNGTAKDGNWTATIPGQPACTTLTIYVTATDGETPVSTEPHEKHWKDCTDPVIVNVTQSSDEPYAGQPVLVTARVTDDVNVTAVNLTYDGTTVPMTMVSGTAKDGNWTATIPGQPADTTLTIYVTATDGENTVSTTPHEKYWWGPTPQKVPAMTPLGMIALIGLLSVVAATSIRMRKRK